MLGFFMFATTSTLVLHLLPLDAKPAWHGWLGWAFGCMPGIWIWLAILSTAYSGARGALRDAGLGKDSF